MGLLDDLKKQADQVKTQQIQQQSLRADRIQLVEQKMRQTFHYVDELLKQLAVIKPVSPLVFLVPGVVELKRLAFAESFIDYRRRRIGDVEYFDTIAFFLKWSSAQTVTVERDMPPAAQRVRELLYASKLKFTEEEMKNEKGFVVGARFFIPAVVVTDITVKADHEGGRLLALAKNLFGLGVEEYAIPAPEVSEAMLEDFAKALIGQPSNFRRFRAVGVFAPSRPKS